MISAKEARDITDKAIKELDMIGTEILTIAASGLTSVTFDSDISKETQQILKKNSGMMFITNVEQMTDF